MLRRTIRIYFYIMSRCWPKLAAKQAATLLFTPNLPTKLDTIPQADELSVLNSSTIVKVWYGSGKTILLLHGWSGAIEQFSTLLQALLIRGYRVVAPIPKGHFGVDNHMAHPSDFVQALKDVLNHFAFNIDVAIGHSLGGSAIALLHNEGKVFQKTVLISAPSQLTEGLLNFANALSLSTKATQRLLENADEIVGISHQDLDAAKALQHSTQPTLIIHDIDDPEVPFTHALRFQTLHPQCWLFETQQYGHRRILKAPTVVAQILQFID